LKADILQNTSIYKSKVVLVLNQLNNMPWKRISIRGIAPSFLTSALNGSDLPALSFCRFTTDTHWIRGWLGPRASWYGRYAEEKFLHCRESNSGRLARSPSLYRLSYPASSMYMRTRASYILVTLLYLLQQAEREGFIFPYKDSTPILKTSDSGVCIFIINNCTKFL
jgi:hypothetical protein